jgi:hypothetical protein
LARPAGCTASTGSGGPTRRWSGSCRRAAETRAALAIAALLGRAFRLADLVAVLKHATGEAVGEDELARRLAPALEARLLVELPEGSDEDYRFAHDQVRDVLTASLGRHGRRAIHGAIVAALAGRMVALAQHAIAAGEVEPGVRYACRAAEAALTAQAPEEALRVVDLARPVASGPPDRVALLRLRDDALARLQRDQERLATLAELAALSSALGDELLALDVMLRRAAVARALGDGPGAAELAGAARRAAEQRADRGLELRACLELGQALLGSPVGESFQPVPLRPDGGLLSGLDRALLALLPRGGNPVGAGAPAR